MEICCAGNEKQTIPRNKPIILQNKKDFQWLGASLDVNHNGNKNVIVSSLQKMCTCIATYGCSPSLYKPLFVVFPFMLRCCLKGHNEI